MKQPVRHSWFGNGVKPAPRGKWVEYAAYQQLEKLLEEFAKVYAESTISPEYHERAYKMWRAFLEQSGKHMIRTDEGWEDGQAKAIYVEISDSEGLPLSELILDEVNAPTESAV